MRILLLVLVTMLSSFTCSARSMEEIWADVPDSLIPYIDKTHRLEMTDFINMGLKGDVDNIMGSKSVMDTVTGNYIHVTLSEASTLQIKKFAIDVNDSILCVVRTWSAPESESSVFFYDQQWHRLDIQADLQSYLPRLYSRPDTMSVESYNDLMNGIDFTMVKASLAPDNDNIALSLTICADDKEKTRQFAPLLKTLYIDLKDFFLLRNKV